MARCSLVFRIVQAALALSFCFPPDLAAESVYPVPLSNHNAQSARPPRASTATPGEMVLTTPPRPALSAQEIARRKAADNVVTILGSGRQTGDAQFAEDIGNVLEGINGNELRVFPVLGKGAAQNVVDVLYIKSMDMAIVDRDILDYLKKKDPILYGDIDKRVNYIAKLFNTELHIYAKKDIKNLGNLGGKKVSCLKEGSTVAIMCANLFKALNINAQIVFDDGDTARQKVANGEIAAAAHGGNPPIPGFDKLRPEENFHFLAISEEELPNGDFSALRARYLPGRLKHEDYPNLIAVGEDVPTIATSSLLAVYAGPPGTARHQRLQKFVQVFFDNMDSFRHPPRHPKWADVNVGAEVPGWTRFPPALAWLDAKRKSTTVQTTTATQSIAAASMGAGSEVKALNADMKAAFNRFLDDYAKATGSRGTEAQREALYAQFVQWWETVQHLQQ